MERHNDLDEDEMEDTMTIPNENFGYRDSNQMRHFPMMTFNSPKVDDDRKLGSHTIQEKSIEEKRG